MTDEWRWPPGDRTDWTRDTARPMDHNPYVEDDKRVSRVLYGPRGEVLRSFSDRPIIPFGFQGPKP